MKASESGQVPDDNSSFVLMRLGAIGEAVSLLPSLKHLTERVPENHITLLCEDLVARFVHRDFPGINHLAADRFFSNRNPMGLFSSSVITDIFSLVQTARGQSYDYQVCFHTIESWTNGLKPYFFNSVFSAELSAGFKDTYLPNWNILVESRSDYWEPMYLKQLRLMEALTGRRSMRSPWVGISDSRRSNLQDRMSQKVGIDFNESLLMVCAGAADPWRCWPTEKYQSVLRKFVEKYDTKVIFIGTEGERETSADIASVLDEGQYYNLCGLTKLEELPELIDHADMVLANDTGPLHIAVARKVPSVGLFGPGLLNPWASYDVDWFQAVYVRDPEDPYLEDYKDKPEILDKIKVDAVVNALFSMAEQENIYGFPD